jgi:GT2 family glycosyltransferase
MYDIVCSIVIYKNDRKQLLEAIKSFLNTDLKVKLVLVDNSPTDDLNIFVTDLRIEYTHNPNNIGYGGAHNQAIEQSILNDVKYHLVLNPDINFEPKIIQELCEYMEENSDVGLVMPKVLHMDGSIQRLCKLLPSPFDLFFRRFSPNLFITKQRNKKYELESFDYNSILNTPSLSGCFMLIRTSVLKQVGLFDQRYFMYLEDYDLVRRIHKVSKTIFYPYVSVLHGHEKGSYKSVKLLFIHMKSAVKYFNKWGWFYDKERITFNKATLERLNHSNQ